jgi:hypothetical protein
MVATREKERRLMVWPHSVIIVWCSSSAAGVSSQPLVRRIARILERAQKKSLPDIEHVWTVDLRAGHRQAKSNRFAKAAYMPDTCCRACGAQLQTLRVCQSCGVALLRGCTRCSTMLDSIHGPKCRQACA